jgi:polar amino acid transport system substrate-binding protein
MGDSLRSIDVCKRVLCTGMLLLMLAPGAAFAAQLVVGANVGNVPWEFQDAQGNIVGFEIDLS